MTFIAPTDDTTSSVGVVDESVALACDVCVHPIAEHDSISLRYCKATLSSALSRRCICAPSGA